MTKTKNQFPPLVSYKIKSPDNKTIFWPPSKNIAKAILPILPIQQSDKDKKEEGNIYWVESNLIYFSKPESQIPFSKYFILKFWSNFFLQNKQLLKDSLFYIFTVSKTYKFLN